MSPFFIALALMVVTSVLLTFGAGVRAIWLRSRQAVATELDAQRSAEHSRISDMLLLLAVAMSWYSVSAGWAGQLVCYPIYADMSAHGPEAFHAYSNGYLSRWASGTWPVGLMCLTWAVLLWLPPRNVPKRLIWGIMLLCITFAVVTPPAASAQSHMLAEGFSEEYYAQLMSWNAGRASVFTLIGILALIVMHRRLAFTQSRDA